MAQIGARGTDDLLPEQRPRSRKRTRMAQPYRRKRRDRQLGPTLEAMLAGESTYGNPADFQRARQRALRRLNGRGISGA